MELVDDVEHRSALVDLPGSGTAAATVPFHLDIIEQIPSGTSPPAPLSVSRMVTVDALLAATVS